MARSARTHAADLACSRQGGRHADEQADGQQRTRGEPRSPRGACPGGSCAVPCRDRGGLRGDQKELAGLAAPAAGRIQPLAGAVGSLPAARPDAGALLDRARAATLVLHIRLGRCLDCRTVLDLDAADELGLDERIDAGDRFAAFDSLTVAISELERVRDALDQHLCGPGDAAPGTLARLEELRAVFAKQDAAGLDAGGKEPQRSGMRQENAS